MEEEIGYRIKEIRKKKGMSLKELAEKVDLTSSFLSQLENNKTAISISALKKIAEALDAKISYLLGEEKEESESEFILTKASERKTMQDFGSGLKLQLMLPLYKRHSLEPSIHVLEPHIVSGVPPYQHEGEEFIYLLKGKIILRLGDESLILEKDDSCYFDSRIKHSFESIYEDGESEVLCVSSKVFFN